MIASKGGITYDRALELALSEASDLFYALALAQGAEVDWATMEIRPPKLAQDAAAKSGESMSFGR